jgi:enoyl-CoA hydratase
MTYETLTLERDGPLAVLTVDRPDAMNVLDQATLAELDQAWRDLERDPEVRCVLVTGAGDEAFVAGADIEAMREMGPNAAEDHARLGHALMDRIEESPLVAVAAVNGYALGGGLELALACDVRLASDNAVLGLPEVGLGIIPGFGGTQRLPRVVGEGEARELVLTGKRVSAGEAAEIGLVNDVVDQAKLLDRARNLAGEVLENGPVAVRLAKEVMTEGLRRGVDSGLELERKTFGLAFGTEDQEEGMDAFLERRTPHWEGR